MTNLEKTLAGLEFARNFFKARADMATPGSDGHLLLLGSMKACANAAELLKAQEAVEPTWRLGVPFCSNCGRQFMRGYKYCPDCGRAVKWE